MTSEAFNHGVSDIIRKSTSFSVEGISHLLNNFRSYAKRNASIRLDFDSEASLTSEDYHNLTGLTRTQFDDSMAYVGEIKTSKSRSIRTCVAILLL